jgi:NADH-quinone oxidoreductase subunit G
MEPGFDHAHPAAAMSAMGAADTVIALTAYASDELLQTADCLLPIAPFTETAGSFVNCAGTLQTFTGVVRCAGDSRPAWKVLRVLGNLLELTGFDQDSTDQVRAAALPAELVAGLSKSIRAGAQGAPMAAASADQLERIADVPVYFSDPIVRRAASLQQTTDADAPAARINAATLAKLGLQSGQSVRVTQGAAASAAQAVVSVVLDDGVADGVVRLAAAHTLTSTLAAMVGPIRLERV